LKPQIPSSQSSKGKQAGRQAGKKSVSSETAKEKWIWVKFRKLKNTQQNRTKGKKEKTNSQNLMNPSKPR
jgi:hypothetical protein